jgi:AAA+ superfamily predicted ATPase
MKLNIHMLVCLFVFLFFLGTGKSSTILAIASFLQKNPYYVDLTNVETNEELQMIFDYVYTNCVSGGIVVMEDIDCMTDVVKKRAYDEWTEIKSSNDSSVNALVDEKKNKLSLSYLLNLLQGSLTKENMIFLATTNHLQNLDPAFYRDGRFDVRIEMKKCNHYQISNIYKKFLDRDLPPNLLYKIEENKYTPANIIFHIKDYLFVDDINDEDIINELISKDFS